MLCKKPDFARQPFGGPGSATRAASAASKQASGARTTPAPIWPVPGIRPAMPVLMSGAIPVSTTRHTSIPTGVPALVERRHAEVRVLAEADLGHLLRDPDGVGEPARADEADDGGRGRHREAAEPDGLDDGAVADVGVRVLGRRSRGSRGRAGMLTGAVNQRSPRPATRMPKSVPLRAIVVTIVEPAMPRPDRRAALPAAMARFRKNWSLPRDELREPRDRLGVRAPRAPGAA